MYNYTMQQRDIKKKLFIAIDGNAIVHRAYHAYPVSLTNSQGIPVNAIYGFTVMLLEILKRFDPEYIVCAFDTGKPTFRHVKYTDYKVHRKLPEQALLTQFPLVEDLVRAFNIPVIMVDGYEADDVLGTLAQYIKNGKWSDQNIEMVIVSGDRDLLQLIDKDVNVCLPQGNFKSLTVFNRDSTKEKYGYYPEQVIDYKAIVGDPSDNIPGIKGVGDKSALELLEKYGSLNEIYKNLDQLKPRQANLFKEGIEQAEFSRELATIFVDVPFKVMLEECLMRDFSRQKVVDEFIKYEFKSLIDKIPNSLDQEINNVSLETAFGGVVLDKGGSQFNMFGTVEDASSGQYIEQLEDSYKGFSLPIEEFVAEVMAVKDLGDYELFTVYISPEEAVDSKDFLAFGLFSEGSLQKQSVIHIAPQICEQIKCFTELFYRLKERETFGFNVEDMMSSICSIREQIENDSRNDVPTAWDMRDISLIKDIKLLSHIISSASKGFKLSDLALEYLKKNLPEKFTPNDVTQVLITVSQLKNVLFERANKIENSSFTKINVKKAKKSLVEVSQDLGELHNEAQENIVLDFTLKIETKVAEILAEIEQRGLQIDVDKLRSLKSELMDKIAGLEKEVYDFVGHEFNLNSPKQLSNILYNTLHLPRISTGKKADSTDEDTLIELQAYSEIITPILESRRLKKLLGTYVDAFLEILSQRGQCELPVIRTDFKLTVASSGRLSSQNPNLQNLPVKGNYADRFREVFVARDGYKLVSIDYSQIELRMMAEISQDKDLIEIFKKGADIHSATAAKIFNVSQDLVTKEQRSIAKTVVFGVLYGQTSFGLSKQLGISREDATQYISEYFNEYQGVAVYIDDATKKAQRLGYVESMFGRRRYISGLNAENRMLRAAAIREAVNMPLQGSAADLMKLAMIKIDYMIKERFEGKAFILLQVHDELIFEVAPEVLSDFEKYACEVMQGVMDFSIPLEVHFSSGDNLAELK